MERWFERALWMSRLAVLVAVVASVLLAFVMLVVATVDALRVLPKVVSYLTGGAGEALYKLRLDIVGDVIEVVDGYLLGAILLIFAMGLYELFISKIDLIESSDVAGRLLLIRSMDDLKSRLASVMLLILIVKFFQQALKLTYSSPLELLQLGLGVLLVGLALYFGYGHAHRAGAGDVKR
jgi:uncharacterized membrane protein YqhA